VTCSVGDFAPALDATEGSVSFDLRLLLAVGFVVGRRDGCDICGRLAKTVRDDYPNAARHRLIDISHRQAQRRGL
jgi:hypothetical protein